MIEPFRNSERYQSRGQLLPRSQTGCKNDMNKPRSLGRAALATAALAILLSESLVSLAVAPAAKADSEASSEAGSESGGGGGRRRRGYYRRMMRQQQQGQPRNMQAMGHERQVQQDKQMEDQHLRSLNGANTTREYNYGGHHRQRGNRNQSAQQGTTTSAQNTASQASSPTP